VKKKLPVISSGIRVTAGAAMLRIRVQHSPQLWRPPGVMTPGQPGGGDDK
jgi:hypothetical protein